MSEKCLRQTMQLYQNKKVKQLQTPEVKITKLKQLDMAQTANEDSEQHYQQFALQASRLLRVQQSNMVNSVMQESKRAKQQLKEIQCSVKYQEQQQAKQDLHVSDLQKSAAISADHNPTISH